MKGKNIVYPIAIAVGLGVASAAKADDYTTTKNALTTRGWPVQGSTMRYGTQFNTDSWGYVPFMFVDSLNTQARADSVASLGGAWISPNANTYEAIVGHRNPYTVADYDAAVNWGEHGILPQTSGTEEKGLEGKVNKDFRVFPNPARGTFTSTHDGSVYNALGRLVTEVKAGQKINVNEPGVYFVRDSNGNSKQVVLIK